MHFSKSDWKLFLAECIGTALLLFFGLSIVIFNWGEGSPVASMIPDLSVRRFLTGFAFGLVGCLVTISPVGKISGAHINPAVSLGFWLRGKMHTTTFIGYVISQMAGAVLGSAPLLLWGSMGHSVEFGITLPGETGLAAAFWGEVIATACLIFYLYIFIGTKRLRNYTPYGIPFLYAILVWAETIYSGCSTNPARSFGPAVIAQHFNSYWLYILAPFLGVFIVTFIFRLRRLSRVYRMEAARVSFHERRSPLSLRGQQADHE